MPRKNNRKYSAKIWSADGNGLEIKLRAGSDVRGYKFEWIEPLKAGAGKAEREWYKVSIEPLKNRRK